MLPSQLFETVIIVVRETIIFLSPVVPMISGPGISLRAGLQLEALAKLFVVRLHVILPGDKQGEAVVPPELAMLCESINYWSGDGLNASALGIGTIPVREQLNNLTILRKIIDPRPALDWIRFPHLAHTIISTVPKTRENVNIHCFRLVLCKLGVQLQKLLGKRAKFSVLDLDDFESRVAERTYRTSQLGNGRLLSLMARMEIKKIIRLERLAIKSFDKVLVCSKQDQEDIEKYFQCSNLAVVPNGIRPVATSAEGISPRKRQSLLFVGTLNYGPNIDGLEFFFNTIYPQLRRQLGNNLRIVIAGRKPPPWIVTLHDPPWIEIIVAPETLTEIYAGAIAAIVPLRMGGGTRIKILEAMAHGVPVVSTSMGAEGLPLVHNKTALIADSADDFANSCKILIQDASVGKSIINLANVLVRDNFFPEAILRKLTDVYCK